MVRIARHHSRDVLPASSAQIHKPSDSVNCVIAQMHLSDFSPMVCLTILLASITIARAENIPARKSGSQAARNQQLICDAVGLQLGEVVVGRASSKLVTITNIGRTSLTVLSASSTRAEFRPTGLDLLPIRTGVPPVPVLEKETI
jgi:hypothetical protein